MDHCFGADEDFCIGGKQLELILFFDVDRKGFVDIHGLVKDGFVVIHHGLGDEGKLVKNMENDVVKSALIILFIQIAEFCKIIIGDPINEKILEEHLHCKGSNVCFFTFLCCPSSSA